MLSGIADGGIHWQTSGSGPDLLFIHAGVADSRMWRDQMGLEGWRCVAFDKRGFGQTPWADGEYSDTDDAIAVLDAIGIDTAVIVGCSMGGATALDLAIEHPGRVDGLVLAGAFPSGWVPDGGWTEEPLEAEAEEAAAAEDWDRVVEIELQMWLVGYGRDSSAVSPELKDLFRQMDRTPVPTEARRNEYQRGFDKRLVDHLDSIEVPTLVIVGEHDEQVLVEAAHYLAERLSDQSAVVLPDTAHLPSLERPDEFNSALSAFLATL